VPENTDRLAKYRNKEKSSAVKLLSNDRLSKYRAVNDEAITRLPNMGQPQNVPITTPCQDIGRGTYNAPEAFINMIQGLPAETIGTAGQAITNPSRVGENIEQGFGSMFIGAGNIPKNVADYLASKEYIKPETAALFDR